MRHVVLIIDDEKDKIEHIRNAVSNSGLKSHLEFKMSDSFDKLLKNNEKKNDFQEFFDETISIIKQELSDDCTINTLFLDLDLTGKGNLLEAYNHLVSTARNKVYLSDQFIEWSPYLVVWTVHDLSTFGYKDNNMIKWHELLLQHGVDLIVDNNPDANSLARSLKFRIDTFVRRSRETEKKLARTHRRNVEVFPAVIMFTDIESFTGLFELFYDDPGMLATLVDDALSICGDSVIQYGGTIHKYIGDAMMAYFPRQKVYYNDDQYNKAVISAVLAAVRIQETVMLRTNDVNYPKPSLWAGKNRVTNSSESGENPISINIGIAGGEEIIWGTFGHYHYKEFTLIGDPVNRAARYEGKAEHGAIVMDSQIGKYLCTFGNVQEIKQNTQKSSNKNSQSDKWYINDIWNHKDIENKKRKCIEERKLPLIRCFTRIKIGGNDNEKIVYVIINESWSHISEKDREGIFK